MYYDTIAKGYNELYGEEQLRKLSVIKQKLQVSPSDKLLDVGCGTGISMDWPCSVIGIDPSIELIKQAKNAIWASAEELPFPDDDFDIVISITAIQNFTDIKKALKEMKRVAKDRIIISFLKRSQLREYIESLLKHEFFVEDIIEEPKDIIFFLRKPYK
ncbi:MAG: methyltransferase domain-containing protein [Candidatus Woesearchaeota archaeon]